MPRGKRGKQNKALAKQTAKAEAKTKVIQKVTVNIGGRGRGGRRTAAPRTAPPVQIFNSMAGPQAEGSRSALGEPMIQSAQLLQRLLEPVNMRLESLIRQRQEMPNINIHPANVQVNQASIPPFRQEPRRDNAMVDRRPRVLDLPDEPLIQPEMPLVPGGYLRMDNPHEEVPIQQGAGKHEAPYPAAESADEPEEPSFFTPPRQTQAASSSGASSSVRGDGRPNYENVDVNDIPNLKIKRGAGDPSDILTLEGFLRHYGVPIPREGRKKDDLIKMVKAVINNRDDLSQRKTRSPWR